MLIWGALPETNFDRKGSKAETSHCLGQTESKNGTTTKTVSKRLATQGHRGPGNACELQLRVHMHFLITQKKCFFPPGREMQSGPKGQCERALTNAYFFESRNTPLPPKKNPKLLVGRQRNIQFKCREDADFSRLFSKHSHQLVFKAIGVTERDCLRSKPQSSAYFFLSMWKKHLEMRRGPSPSYITMLFITAWAMSAVYFGVYFIL